MKISYSPLRLNQVGFTLIEAMVAMAILTIGFFSVSSMQVVSIRGNSMGNALSTAANINSEQVEQLISKAFGDKDWLQDRNGNGKDGLNDKDAAADYSSAQYAGLTKGAYELFINIADGTPVPETKLIQVIVRDNSARLNNAVSFQYIKNANI